MLSDEAIEKITLAAPFVHKHGEGPPFKRLVNQLCHQLRTPDFLNYFIRYRVSRENKDLHRWSRIEAVYDIAEWRALAAERRRSGDTGSGAERNRANATPMSSEAVDATRGSPNSPSPSAKDFLLWQGKHFFIGFKVSGEEHLVSVKQLSSKPPTAEEVRAFCARESMRHPHHLFPIPSGGMAAPPSTASPPGEDTVNPPPPPPDANLASYLPTPELVELLGRYRKQLESPKWREEECEESRRRSAPFAAAAAAASPIQRTATALRHRRFTTSSSNAGLVGGYPPSSAAMTTTAPLHDEPALLSHFTSEEDALLLASQASTELCYSRPGSQQSQPLPWVVRNEKETGVPLHSPLPSSPFLPKKRQARQSFAAKMSTAASQEGRGGEGGGAAPRKPSSLLGESGMTASAEAAADLRYASGGLTMPLNTEEGGGKSGASPPHAPVLDPAHLERWVAEAKNLESFKAYIVNPQRIEQSEKLVSITQSNEKSNRQLRLLGLANQNKQMKTGNLTESGGGLWVTDDEIRAQKAMSYASRTGGAGSEKEAKHTVSANPGVNATSANARGPPDAVEETDEAVLRVFRERRTEQEVSLRDVAEELFRRLATPPQGSPTTSHSTPGSGSSRVPVAASPYRLVNPLDAASQTPRLPTASPHAAKAPSSLALSKEALYRAQLVHRSGLVHAGVTAPHASSSSPSPSATGKVQQRKRTRD